MTRVKQLPSKIVQIDGWHVLCEDGSCWQMSDPNQPLIWKLIHPPHEPPTQDGTISAMRHERQLTQQEVSRMASSPTHAADLAEALAVLRNIIDTDCEEANPTEIEIIEAYAAAEALLKKHGA